MAKYALTDHEYRIVTSLLDDVTPWIGCTLSNTGEESDGTYTIFDIPDQDIPVGHLQVRTKAIGGRHASAILSNDTAFVGTTFNFRDGIFPDGVNDYLEIESLNTLPISYCFNIFTRWNIEAGAHTFFNLFTDLDHRVKFTYYEGNLYISKYSIDGYFERVIPISFTLNELYYVSFNFTSLTTMDIYINGAKFGSTIVFESNLIRTFDFLRIFANLQSNEYFKNPSDEITIYNRVLTPAEIASNYNSGVGENPVAPEDLLLHLDFNEGFETFTFPDGSALGIRDKSGNNNHAKQFNMDTDPLSPNYVLKPFNT